jgi:predicted site-specific integrase-resolvase
MGFEPSGSPTVGGVERPAEKLLTTAQAAEHLGISRGTLARYARDGLLKPTLTLPTGHLRWSLEDLRRQMRELRERPDDA